MASPQASICKPSKKAKFIIIPPKQLFIDLTKEETTTPSPKFQVSSPSAPNAPSKTPTLLSSPSTNGYLNSILSPPPRVPPPPLTRAPNSMEITLSRSPITPLDVHHNSLSLSPPIIGHPIPWNLLKAHVSASISNEPVKDYVNDVKSGCLCAIYGKCMITETHHACVHLVVTKMNESQKSKSVKKHKNLNVWKPTGNVFTDVGYKWKPTGQTFTIVGKSCPLTRITSTNVVPPKQTPSHSVEIQKIEIKVYNRKHKNVKNIGSSKMAKIVESKNANHSEPNHTWGSIATDIPSSSSLVMTVRFGNDQITRIMGYGDFQLGNIIISR
nr:hypothetical protein [Tanacetum cinerariifolium]